jgi:hypothetical protein
MVWLRPRKARDPAGRGPYDAPGSWPLAGDGPEAAGSSGFPAGLGSLAFPSGRRGSES